MQRHLRTSRAVPRQFNNSRMCGDAMDPRILDIYGVLCREGGNEKRLLQPSMYRVVREDRRENRALPALLRPLIPVEYSLVPTHCLYRRRPS
jgi:hypothetical protein